MALNIQPGQGTRLLPWRFIFFAALAFSMAEESRAESAYRFVDLGAMSSYDVQSSAIGINNVGQVIGEFYSSPGLIVTAVWTETTMTWLHGSDRYSRGSAINDLGQAVGDTFGSTSPHRAVLWEGGKVTTLHPFIPPMIDRDYGSSSASAINNAGQIVGSGLMYLPDGIAQETHAALWPASGAQAIDLGTLKGGHYSEASGINDAGQVVGTSQIADGHSHATLWKECGCPLDLGTFNGGVDSEAWAINNAGQILGSSSDADGRKHSILWVDGVPLDLGVLTGQDIFGADINNVGQIVGTLGGNHAVLWDGKTAIDLNEFVKGSGWLLETANGINDRGWIVGDASNASSGIFNHAYLLIPVPEPEGLVLAGAGLGVIALGRVSKKKQPRPSS